MLHLPCEPTIAGEQAPPPYDAKNVRVFGFPLSTSHGTLRALCRQFLDSGPNTFEPVSDNVILEVLTYAELKVRTAPWDTLPVRQQELLFSVPVRRYRGGMFVEYGIFIPYIFVDDQFSAYTGREALGLPKLIADFQFDANYPTSGPISMSMETRVPGGIAKEELIKVQEAKFFPGPREFSNEIIRFFGPLGLYRDLSDYEAIKKLYRSSEMIGFSSRILIDPETLGKDLFKSLHRSKYEQNFKSSAMTAPASVTLKKYRGIDMAGVLGLLLDAGGNAPSVQTYRLDADFTLGSLTSL